VTPVPLELPLRPAEAAAVANLIFDQAEGKPLSDDVRTRLAARAAVVKFQTLTPFFGSLERDPVHHSVYYLAVDSETEPLLLHMALATAPTSSIYYKPLLIGRMRRPNGSEMVINAIPFGPHARQNVETFAARINSAFYPKPQGARTTITVEEGHAAAFDTFRALHKRTGKNFAALAGDYHAAMFAAIRAGWRNGYTAATDLSTVEDISGREGFSRYSVVIPAGANGMEDAEKIYQQIRQARGALKISRGFDLQLDAAVPMTPQVLRSAVECLKERGHAPQLVDPGPLAEKDLDEMAATAQHFQITLSFHYRGESAETVRGVAKTMTGRLDYRGRDASEGTSWRSNCYEASIRSASRAGPVRTRPAGLADQHGAPVGRPARCGRRRTRGALLAG
jgi:hypothetical protein